jgi:uncharacterized membrane protein
VRPWRPAGPAHVRSGQSRSGRPQSRRGELSLARVESFSDSVFAFAMTLLVLGLVVPKLSEVHSNADLLRQLGRQWPTFVAYLVSFLFIGQVWLQHHRLLGYLARADHWAVWLNAALLLDVVSISFVTGLLGTYAGHPGGTAAAVIYGITWTVGGVFFNGLWWYGRRAGLIDPALSPADVRRISVRWGTGPILYAVCTLLTLVQFWLGVAGFAALVALYLVPPPRAQSQDGPPEAGETGAGGAGETGAG